VWRALRGEVERQLGGEPLLGSFLRPTVLAHGSFGAALAALLAQKLACPTLTEASLREIINRAHDDAPSLLTDAVADLLAFCARDPACDRYALPFLYYKGYQGLQLHRVGAQLWRQQRRDLALYMQSRVSEVFAIDIHPAARIGRGILIDHATSLVIGETAVVGDNVSMLHEVTLGGTGKDSGDRHPKVGAGVLIGAGAKILGNVRIGAGSKIGAGSVVLDDVPAHSTAVGVPAAAVGECHEREPALEMEHRLRIDSPAD
ncbi:MAG: serine O-acetyltransferase, partial [bacterium]